MKDIPEYKNEVGVMSLLGENLTPDLKPSIEYALDKLEVLENAARMTLITEITGKKKILSPSRLREIDRLFR